MSLSQSSQISASDFNTLKTAIYTECARRQMNNPITYTQISNASAGNVISASQFVNLATPLRVLDAFTTKGLDVQYYTTATQSGQTEATVTITNPQGSVTKTVQALESIVNEAAGHAAANNTDCRNSCAGLCTNACSSCSGCTGCTGCSNACSGCTGCTNACSGCTGCSGGCTGCTGCSGGCSGCGSGCAGSCGGCGGNCYGNCWNQCGSSSCGGSCWSVCTGGTHS